MAKQKNNFSRIANIIKFISCLFLIGSFFVMFGSGLKMTVKSSSGNVVTTYKSAYSFLFGQELVSEHVTYANKSVTVLGIVAFALLALTVILLIGSLLLSNKKGNKASVLSIVSTLTAITTSVMFLCLHKSTATILADAIVGAHSDAIAKTIFNNTALDFGFWGVAMFGIIASVLLLTSLFFDGTVDKIREALSSNKE